MNDAVRALSALHSLDPGCARETWVRIGMAAKDAGLSLEDFAQWSSGASNFASERDCAQVWRSIHDGPVKAATLFSMAFRAGWQDPARTRKNGHRTRPSVTEASEPIEPRQMHRKADSGARTIWERCEPATHTHPYIVAKRGRPDGLRVVPVSDGLVIAGHRVAGWLVVPAIALTGELRTLQFIPPPGNWKKLNLKDAPFSDGLFIIGDMAECARIFIVEGIGQAWACWSGTGCAAVVCFGAGRMATVAEAVRRAHPERRIVLVPDRGKEQRAEAIARQIRGEWVQLPGDKPANYDANDYASEHGACELDELLDKARRPSFRYQLLTADDVANRAPMEWLVRGVLPAHGLAAVYGASGSGKSFLALDLCAAIAKGAEWFGCRVRSAPAIYVALEGEAGFRQRVRAWQAHHGRELPASLHFILQPLDLRNAEDVAELAEAVNAAGCKGAIVVIDTLNRAASGADENSSADMGALIDGATAVQARLGGLVLLIHHCGKDETKGLRGHSSLLAALDAAIEVRRNSDRREWRIVKTKDDANEAAYPFRLEVVEVGEHDDGQPITSCAVVPDETPAGRQRPPLPQGPTQKLVYDALGPLLRASPHYGKAGAPAGRPCVELEGVIPTLGAALACRPDQRKYQTRRAITAMAAQGVVQMREGWIWLP